MTWIRCLLFGNLGLALGVFAWGGEAERTKHLRFSKENISRYSLDQVPRSLSIRQGERWMGYDLERAKVYKAWQSPPDKSGLQGKGFVVGSAGPIAFVDKSESTWRLKQARREIPLRIRYLGVTELGSGNDLHFILNWELRHDDGRIELTERIPLKAPASAGLTRLIQISGIPAGFALGAPHDGDGAWDMAVATEIDFGGKPPPPGERWFRLTLVADSSIPRK